MSAKLEVIVNVSRRNMICTVALTSSAYASNIGKAEAQNLTPIVAGGVITVDTVPLWYGMQQGTFARSGLDVSYQRVTSGTAATLGVVAGTYNVGDTNLLSVLQAKAKGIPIDAIAPLGIFDSTTNYIAAVVKKDSALQRARDLNGRIIGSQGVKDMSAMALMTWIDQNGGDSKSIKIIELPSSSIPAALEEGRIDVATLQQPFLSQALGAGKIRIFANSYESLGKRFLLGVWVANSAWAAANAEAVRSFVRILLEGQLWANAHHPEAATLASQYTGVDAATILKGGLVPFSQTLITPQDMEPVIEAAVKYGAIDKRIAAIDVVSPVVRPMLR
jgi:NitT/TauT family transport system substrate-binding protein